MFPRTNRKALQYALLTLSTRGPGYHRESAVILCVSYNNFVPRNVARGLLSATVGQPERTNKSVIPPCSTRADSISLFLYLSLFPSLLLSLSALTNSRIWKNCNSIFRRGLGRCACIIVFLWYFSFLSTFGLQRAYEPFLGKSLLASGIASNDWSVRMAVFGCYIRVSYASLCVSSPPTSLLGLRELVNRPKKKKENCNSFQGLAATVGQLERYGTELYPCSNLFLSCLPFLPFLSFLFGFVHELVNRPGKIVLCTKLGPRL